MERLKKLVWPLFACVILINIVFYIIWDSYHIITRISFLATLLVLISIIILNFEDVKKFFIKGFSKGRFLFLIQIVLLFAISVFLYILSSSINFKMDFTSGRLYSLTPETKKLLSTITNEVKILYFKPLNLSDPVLDYIENLLKRYVERNKNLKFKIVDPIQNRAMAVDYEISENGSVVFQSEQGKIVVSPRKVVDQNIETTELIYRGEEVFTKTLKNLLVSKPKNVYILQGHGEINPNDKSYYGFNTLIKYLKQENVQLKELNLLKTPEIPLDCNLIIIGNPKKSFSVEELDKIANYLDEGGNILVMLEYETDFTINDILRRAGCFYLENIIVEDEDYLPQLGRTTIVPNFIEHEITKPLISTRKIIFMPSCVGILTLPQNQLDTNNYSYEIFPLLTTSKTAWGEINKIEIMSNRVKKDSKDLAGPLSIAFYVKRVTKDKNIEARIGIIGDTDFVNNLNIDRYSNFEFFINLINYLLKREGEVGINPKVSGIKGFKLASSERRFLQIICFLPLVLFLIAGFAIVIQRKKIVILKKKEKN